MTHDGKIRCLAVDDEPPALDILKKYISTVSTLELAGTCNNAVEALNFLRGTSIDLLFLDIQMPQLLGTDLIRTLKNPPRVIFTTAHRKFALEGFELDAIDYLLKPISLERFLKAVNKLPQQSSASSLPALATTAGERTYFFFSVGKKKVKVFLDEILYIESLREYVRITTKEKNILTKFQLSRIEELLSQNNFLRIHRSFIVAKDKISAFTTVDVEINNKQIPIGRSYKEWVVALLEKGSS